MRVGAKAYANAHGGCIGVALSCIQVAQRDGAGYQRLMRLENFSDKLALVLKTLVMSRTGLAAAINVDKSLVGRWVAGTVTPSEHNLANLTRYIATQIDGFTLLDWERDLPGFSGKLGISDHAQAELGDIVHIDLPELGAEFTKQESISCVESVKTAADIYQMCDGEVVEVNETLNDDASLVNADAEGKGWIMKVKMADSSQMEELLTADAYKEIL